MSAASTTTTEGFGVAVTREETTWRCSLLAPELLDDLDGVITGLRRVATTGPVFGMLAVDDEFFVIVRPIPGGAALLLSDATAGLDYDIAADVLDLLQVSIPEDDEVDDDPWPEGDLTLLADLGVPEQEMQLIVDDVELYPDEQLTMIAQRCGFGEAFAAVLEKVRPRSPMPLDGPPLDGPLPSMRPASGERATDADLIRLAMALAGRTAETADVPIGAVVVSPEGVTVGEGWNAREATSDPTGHAEIVALRAAARSLGTWNLAGCTMAVTVEPCTMCAGAAVAARLATVVFGCWEPKTGAAGSLWDVLRDRRLPHRVQVRGGVLEAECADLVRQFFVERRKLG